MALNKKADGDEFEPGGGRAQREKKEKPLKKKDTNISPDTKNSADKTDKKKKKKKGGLIKIIVTAVLVLAVSGFLVGVLRFDLLGARTGFVALVNGLDPAYVALEDRALALNAREAALKVWEEQLKDKEAAVQKKETVVTKRETEVESRERNSVPLYRRLNEEDLADMESLSKTYARMDSATAAKILSELYQVEDMAAILYYMSESSAAAILEKMKTDLAVRITQELLRT